MTTLMKPNHSQTFERARPSLLGLAYRILGSRADAEDAVQDTFLKWASTDRQAINNAGAWLKATCTRRCLDLLRAAHRSRVDYVGAWLPEPIHTPIELDVPDKLDLATSLTTAFMLVLERLTPKERAAYLLHDIFDVPYPEIAATLNLKESACRKLVSRAKSSIAKAKVRHATPLERQDRLLAAFWAAIDGGVTDELAALLSEDVRLATDGGGKVPALLEPLSGKQAVLAFLAKGLRDYWADYQWSVVDINGRRGIVLKQGGETHAAVSFAFDELGQASGIYIMRNPDKLARLDAVAIH